MIQQNYYESRHYATVYIRVVSEKEYSGCNILCPNKESLKKESSSFSIWVLKLGQVSLACSSPSVVHRHTPSPIPFQEVCKVKSVFIIILCFTILTFSVVIQDQKKCQCISTNQGFGNKRN